MADELRPQGVEATTHKVQHNGTSYVELATDLGTEHPFRYQGCPPPARSGPLNTLARRAPVASWVPVSTRRLQAYDETEEEGKSHAARRRPAAAPDR